MDRVILTLSRAGTESFQSAKASLRNPRIGVIPKEIITLGLILALLQILDGVLTAVGVAHLGTEVEGNTLIRFLMEHLGYIPALVVIKTVALGVIAGICVLSSKVQWLEFAMKAVICIYLGAAIIPWGFVIAKHIL
ncbi:MAG: hypothetical protein J0M12_02545 [Deltaproteobacteria bacterium]|nr:hypothetical protein [Deltaproteobacteria bacterium]